MITVYEDNAGGIHFMDDAQGHYVFTENAEQAGQLINDVLTFDEWCKDASGFREASDALCGDPILEYDGTTIIVYPEVMGNAGKLYAGIAAS